LDRLLHISDAAEVPSMGFARRRHHVNSWFFLFIGVWLLALWAPPRVAQHRNGSVRNVRPQGACARVA
jgi:hypothetical protein